MLALALLAATPIATVVAMVVGVIGLVLAAGTVAGQFRRGVVSELRDSLSTANTELDIERKRSDRLEEVVRDLERRLGALEAENRVLRETLQTGIRLAPEFQAIIAAQLADHEKRSEVMLREAETRAAEVADKVTMTLEAALAAFEQRKIDELHTSLAASEARLTKHITDLKGGVKNG